MEKDEYQRILDTIYDLYPNATCELNFTSLYELTVAVVLSAQTNDKVVNQVTPGLFSHYPDFNALALTSVEAIENDIKRIGLFHHKASNLNALAKRVLAEYNSQVPNNFNDLITLPGIGRKTANVILAVGFHIPALAVDTHVFRVSHRLGLVDDMANVEVTEQQLMLSIPKEQWIKAHHAILFLGRYTCLARNPLCKECPLANQCLYLKKMVV
ncbi:MAG: endonuclease III [Erysipelotrichaceae bacterium]